MKRFSDVKKKNKVNKSINEKKVNLFDKNINIIKENKSEEKNDVVRFFSKLFESREMAHIYHLTVKGDDGSYAKHKATEEYYSDVLNLIDDVIEVYQGQYGLIEGYEQIDTKKTKTLDVIDYFTDLGKYIIDEKKCFENEDTHIHSLIDDILILIYKTLYKLKFNK